MSSAETLRREAVDAANRGRFRAAERLLDRAGRLTDDIDILGRIAGTRAVILVRTGYVEEAERLCLETLGLPGLSDSTVAILEGQLGSIAEFAGRLDDADRWLSRAISTVEEPVARANLLINRSLIGMQRRDLDRAAADTTLAAKIYAAHRRPVDEAEARHNLGYIDLLRGDLVAALTEMGAARETLADASRTAGAVSDLDRAEVLREAGVTREAEELLARAASTFGSARMPKARAEAEFQLASSLLTHDARRAVRVAKAAARRFRALGNRPWSSRAEAIRLRAELSEGRVTRSGGTEPRLLRASDLDEIDSTVRSLEDEGLSSDAAALRLSHQLWAARQGDGAGRVAGVPKGAPIDVHLLAHEVRAAKAAARGRHAMARAHAARGLDALSDWQRDFGSLDLQTSIVMHGNGLMGAGLKSAISSGRPDVVFEWSERARHLSLQVVPLRPPPDEDLADDLAELRMLRADADEDWLATPRAVELQNRARQRQWSGIRSAAVQQRASLDELRGALTADTALCSYVFSGDALSVLVATAAEARIVRLDDWARTRRLMNGLRADLDMAAAVRVGPLADVVRRSLDERLGALSQVLLEPALAGLDARRLVLTVPGVLNGVPWAMLPAMRGRTFTLAASASRWLGFRASPSSLRSAGFAAGPRVPRAVEEITTAAEAWSSAVTLAPARIHDTTELAAHVDVLHIAAHGRHAADNPMFSGLELADGALFGYDVDLIEKVPDTVVISACEVGRSSVRWGEEAVGMTRIWLHAGARSVVAAPVIVADDDACELLGAMHEGLAAGAPPSVALAEASRRTGIVAPFQVHGAGF